jgi:hypothetical protein
MTKFDHERDETAQTLSRDVKRAGPIAAVAATREMTNRDFIAARKWALIINIQSLMTIGY